MPVSINGAGSVTGLTDPAFSAVLASAQSITTSTFTKVQCNTEEYDYSSCYDNVTNYRFQPTIAGIYLLTTAVGVFSNPSMTRGINVIYKNGIQVKRHTDVTSYIGSLTGSSHVYFNGSTDYAEMYVYVTATSPILDATQTYFQASLVRAT